MFRSLLFAVSFLMGVSASASSMHDAIIHTAVKTLKLKPFLTFNVGDTANYNMSISSMTGTMVMKVTGNDSTGVTIEQDVNLGAMGSETVVELINPNTGDIISVTVNGQKQTPPDPNDTQVTSETTTTLTVPAGTYPCIDVKFHMVSENTDGEQWVDTDDVPVGGMLQETTTEQGMPVQVSLTSFTFAN